ncbi:spore coat protein CotH, partial [Candidatus Magnetomorum sp. HK-1]
MNLSSVGQEEIWYTLDGSDPLPEDPRSKQYNGSPIIIEKIVNAAVVVKARACKDGDLGKIQTQSFIFLDRDITMPVVSLSTASENLFSKETGIFANIEEDWEKPVGIEFYEPNGLKGFSVNAGMRLHGGRGRENFQKALKFYLRGSVYG